MILFIFLFLCVHHQINVNTKTRKNTRDRLQARAKPTKGKTQRTLLLIESSSKETSKTQDPKTRSSRSSQQPQKKTFIESTRLTWPRCRLSKFRPSQVGLQFRPSVFRTAIAFDAQNSHMESKRAEISNSLSLLEFLLTSLRLSLSSSLFAFPFSSKIRSKVCMPSVCPWREVEVLFIYIFHGLERPL